MTVYPVIMAGGSGTRFWPLSRKARPKQFLALASDKPLLVDTALRMKGIAETKNILVVCGKLHVRQVRKLLPKLPIRNVLVEPAARNTAPALALASLEVLSRDPDGIIVALPADHFIAKPDAFRAALASAFEPAQRGEIVTVGIKPTFPETGFGYIRLGEPLDGAARRAAAFVEKPDHETAERYLASGDYLWNAGIFVFRADAMLGAISAHAPELWRGLAKLQERWGKRTRGKLLERLFPKLPSISIDYAVAEKAKNIAVVPGDFGWSDVGSFAALPEVRDQDEHGNVVSGKGAVLVDSRGCVVLATDRPLAVVGMSDVVVVDAGDAVLVVPKSRSQEVRRVVDALAARKASLYL